MRWKKIQRVECKLNKSEKFPTILRESISPKEKNLKDLIDIYSTVHGEDCNSLKCHYKEERNHIESLLSSVFQKKPPKIDNSTSKTSSIFTSVLSSNAEFPITLPSVKKRNKIFVYHPRVKKQKDKNYVKEYSIDL